MSETPEHDHSKDPKDLDGDSAFTTVDESVINYKGNNYYLACGELISAYNPAGGLSSCVKPKGHPSHQHEDYQGNARRGWFCKRCFCPNDEKLTSCVKCGWLEASTL